MFTFAPNEAQFFAVSVKLTMFWSYCQVEILQQLVLAGWQPGQDDLEVIA
jgi:hypothetical protein